MSPKYMQLHPLVLWACLLGAIIGLAALSAGILVLAPNSVGLTEQSYAINSAFAFDEWEINSRHGVLSFPEGGLAVEAYRHDHLAAFVIWGKAELSPITAEIDVSELENPQVTVVFMSERELLSARGSICIRSTDSPDAYLEASNLLNNEKRYLPILQMLGNQRVYPFPSGVARFIFFDEAGQRFTFQDGMQVRLQGPNSKQSFWSETPYRLHPSFLDGALATLLYSCCTCILLIATYFSTLGWQYRGQAKRQEGVPSKTGFVYLAFAALYTLGVGLLARLELSPVVKAAYDGSFLVFLVYWLNKQTTLSRQQARNDRRLPLSHLGLGLLLGSLAVFLGQLATPRGLAPLAITDYVLVIGLGLAAALTQEVLWRGLMLDHLSKCLGNFRGLLLTAGLQGIFAFLVWLIHPVSTLGPLNTLLFIPLQAIWLGYTYLRTDRLVAPITISACLAILPQLLLF